MHAQQIISTHPHVQGGVNEALIRCIEECYDCSQACTSCADACLGEEMVEHMVECIRTCLDCADICIAAGQIATRRTGSNEQLIAGMLGACQDACRLCAQECGKHAAKMEHCLICAEACRRCGQACEDARRSLGQRVQ